MNRPATAHDESPNPSILGRYPPRAVLLRPALDKDEEHEGGHEREALARTLAYASPLRGLDYAVPEKWLRRRRGSALASTRQRRDRVRRLFDEFRLRSMLGISQGYLWQYVMEVTSDGRHDVDRRLKHVMTLEHFNEMLALKFTHDHEGKPRHSHDVLFSRELHSPRDLQVLANRHVYRRSRDGRIATPIRVTWPYRVHERGHKVPWRNLSRLGRLEASELAFLYCGRYLHEPPRSGRSHEWLNRKNLEKFPLPRRPPPSPLGSMRLASVLGLD